MRWRVRGDSASGSAHPLEAWKEARSYYRKDQALRLVIRFIIGRVIIVHFIFDVLAVEIDPQEQNISFRRFDVASRKDRRGFLQSHLIAIMQMNGLFAAPCPVTTFHERIAVERSQPRKCGNQFVWAFV